MTGNVVLIGGGPGADDLITIRGLDRLLAADVVIHDRLAPTGLLTRLGRDVEVIDAARAPGKCTLAYDEIVALMIDRARAGKTVVRLKGGDPFVFAHGGQELISCSEAGIAVEVVPGVTSATASAVFANLPLTSSEGAAGFSVVSGHLHPDDPANRVDWTALSRSGTNIVVLMGMRHLAAIADRLVAEGVSPDAEAACVADGSLPTQLVVRARLADLAASVTQAGLANPATVVIEAGAARVTCRALVLGGSRSGKSRYAERLASSAASVTYVATATGDPGDPEWVARIEGHRQRRPAAWETVETRDLAKLFARDDGSVLLVDSITTWLAGVMDDTDAGLNRLSPTPTSDSRRPSARWCVRGPLPGQASSPSATRSAAGSFRRLRAGRRFRDLLGELNQRLAAAAEEVWLVTAGIPQRLR
jgi:uroporphyrin-III C-methyltransferase